MQSGKWKEKKESEIMQKEKYINNSIKMNIVEANLQKCLKIPPFKHYLFIMKFNQKTGFRD